VTDACIDWTTTEKLLRDTRNKLKDVLPKRMPKLAEVIALKR
jgi:3-deoxy-7-phosphoheptulonate synthase